MAPAHIGYLASQKDKQPESNDRCRRTRINNDVFGGIIMFTVRSSDQFTSMGSRLHDIIIMEINVKVVGFSARKYPSCMTISSMGQP